ncbi:MAG: hypothetical protein WC511_02875 [Candidatus Pacearchaeota archaeon]
MVIELFVKVIEKIVSKLTTPEDLIFMSIVLVFGIIAIPLWNKYFVGSSERAKEKPSITKKAEKICPVHGDKPKCQEIPELINEFNKLVQDLQKVAKDNVDIQNRCAKIMNVISKEYEGRWDRYLYDKELTPRDDDVRIPD